MQIITEKKDIKVLALSGHEKASLCYLVSGTADLCDKAFDLRQKSQYEDFLSALDAAIAKYGAPDLIASDFHPDFATTSIADELAAQHHIKHIFTRHHHAHIAAVLAEHQHRGKVLGLALDGLGFGENNELWGGELFAADLSSYTRLGRLKPIRLASGDKGTSQPWRIAAAFLYDQTGKLDSNLPPLFNQALKAGINTPPTSSCGRLFDLAAQLAGFPDLLSFASACPFPARTTAPTKDGFSITKAGALYEADLAQTLLKIYKEKKEGASDSALSELFHTTLASALCALTLKVAADTNIRTVALGGGCFLNTPLRQTLAAFLKAEGMTVLLPKALPPTDFAVPFGMCAIASNF